MKIIAEGIDAIEMAEKSSKIQLNKYTDPTEEAREDISISAAREIAKEDPGLIYATPRSSAAAAAMGRAKSSAKTKAARANGQKGGAPRHWYLILSGEGDNGTWEAKQTTAYGLRRILARERCDGDRWASGWEIGHDCGDDEILLTCTDDGDRRTMDRDEIESLGVPPEAIP